MAIFEKTIRNKDFDKLLRKLEQEIPDSSWSADLEAGSDFKEGDARCSVRVFERYSMMGGNRLSLTLTMFQNLLSLLCPAVTKLFGGFSDKRCILAHKISHITL